MHRIISFVMAIIVMVLSCIPCSDIEAVPLIQGAQAAISATPINNQNSNAADIDRCTPFCTCSCCSGFALLPLEIVPAFVPVFFADAVYGVYQPQSFVDVFLPIWQPPKLA